MPAVSLCPKQSPHLMDAPRIIYFTLFQFPPITGFSHPPLSDVVSHGSNL